jgi:hypothetical protein
MATTKEGRSDALDYMTSEALKELRKLRDRIAHDQSRRRKLLSTLLSPSLDGVKLVSYRLAQQASGVPSSTLLRWFGEES